MKLKILIIAVGILVEGLMRAGDVPAVDEYAKTCKYSDIIKLPDYTLLSQESKDESSKIYKCGQARYLRYIDGAGPWNAPQNIIQEYCNRRDAAMIEVWHYAAGANQQAANYGKQVPWNVEGVKPWLDDYIKNCTLTQLKSHAAYSSQTYHQRSNSIDNYMTGKNCCYMYLSYVDPTQAINEIKNLIELIHQSAAKAKVMNWFFAAGVNDEAAATICGPFPWADSYSAEGSALPEDRIISERTRNPETKK